MSNLNEYVSSFLNFTGAVVVCTAVVLLILLVLSRAAERRRKKNEPQHDFELDFTNMMILFQSMRDMLSQQKDLARDINAMVEKKSASVRKALDQALDEVARMRDTQRALVVQLEDARAELTSLRQRLGETESDTPTHPPRALEPPRPNPAERPAEESDDSDPLRIVAEPMDARPQPDGSDTWVGLDFGEDQPDPLAFEVPEEVPEEPEDAETARDAFRALLDLQQAEPADTEPSPAAQESSNGHGGMPPLHARVYEYMDAGMTIPQISRELGIGKGEVRLIQSLRKDRGI